MLQEELEQLECRRVGPVQVLDHQDHRPFGGHGGQHLEKRRMGLRSQELRCELGRAVALGKRQLDERRHERYRLHEGQPQRRQLLLKRLEPLLRCGRVAQGAPQELDDRIEGAPLEIRGAAPGEPAAAIVTDCVVKHANEPRLPDTRLARDQHSRAAPGRDPCERLAQRVELMLPPHRRRQGVTITGVEPRRWPRAQRAIHRKGP